MSEVKKILVSSKLIKTKEPAVAPRQEEKRQVVHVVDVVREGSQVILPENMTLQEGIQTLHNRMIMEEEFVDFFEVIEGSYYDGAYAMIRAMQEIYGWARPVPTPGFFGPTPPRMISVEVGPNEHVQVPQGRLQLPGLGEDGFVETQGASKNGMICFAFRAHVRRKFEGNVVELANRSRALVKESSIYRGKAFRLRFQNSDDMAPMPMFMDLSTADIGKVIFSKDLQESIKTNILTPIIKREACEAQGIPFKRGVLLAGPYGTGKTLVANATARIAQESGITFVYCHDVENLEVVLDFGRFYGPAVVFCEDIDRIMNGDRTVDMDRILNVLDGIESKSSKLMVILTTNHLNEINKAMLRPGRLDAIINMTAPDAEAVDRLFRLYGKDAISEQEDLSVAAGILAGQIPAVVREAVERAKLVAVKNNINGEAVRIQAEDLEESAKQLKAQAEQLASLEPKEEGITMDELVLKAIKAVTQEPLNEIQTIIKDLDNRIPG